MYVALRRNWHGEGRCGHRRLFFALTADASISLVLGSAKSRTAAQPARTAGRAGGRGRGTAKGTASVTITAQAPGSQHIALEDEVVVVPLTRMQTPSGSPS